MKHLDSMLLIAAGFVLGAIVALAFAPYLLEVKPEGMMVAGLKQGVGDIAGGILGGATAVAAAFGVHWLRDRKESRTEAERRSIRAMRLLQQVHSLHTTTKMWALFFDAVPDAKTSYIDHANGLTPLLRTDIERLEAGLDLASEFEPAFYDGFRKLIGSARSVAHAAEILPKDKKREARLNLALYEGFTKLCGLCDAIVEQLDQIRARGS